MRFILLILLPVLFFAACETRPVNTSQPLTIDVVGVDQAYCILSTKYQRYAVYAPGRLNVERSMEDLKVDCTGSGSRRRVLVVEPEYTDLYYRYPEIVIVDFSTMNHGNRYNGFRSAPNRFNSTSKGVMTEDSFSAPVETSQGYPVLRTHEMVAGSEPVSLN